MIRTLNLKEFSRKGGKATLAKYGPDHYSSIGKKGAKSTLKKYGADYYKKLSQSGVAGRKLKREKAEK